MKSLASITLLAALAAAPAALAAQASPPPATTTAPAAPVAASTPPRLGGTWYGGIDFGDTSIAMTLRITQAADGKLTATTDAPDAPNYAGPVATDISVKDGTVHLDMGVATYDGKLNATNDAIEGNLYVQGNGIPCVFKLDKGN